MKYLKYTFYTLATLVLLLVGFLVYIAVTFDPNEYKPQMISYMKEHHQRTLSLAGDIRLSFFPKLGIDISGVSLSEQNSTDEFAAVERLRFFLAVLPLLKKEVVVDEVRVEGLHARIVRYADGTGNYEDLAGAGGKEDEVKSGAIPFAFDVQGVKIVDSSLTWVNEEKDRAFSVSRLEASTGRIAGFVPTDAKISFRLEGDKPKIGVDTKITAGLAFDLKARRYAIMRLLAEISGEAAGITDLVLTVGGDMDSDGTTKALDVKGFTATLKGKRASDSLDMSLDIPRLHLSSEKISSEKISLLALLAQPAGSLDVAVNIPAMESTPERFKADMMSIEINGSRGGNLIKGKISSPVSGELTARRFDLPAIDGAVGITNPAMPKGRMNMTVAGSAIFDLSVEEVKADLTAKIDESTIVSKLGISGFGDPGLTFDVSVDAIDVDRYLSPPKDKKGGSPAATAAEPGKPLPIGALVALNLDGNIRVGNLKAYNMKASAVQVGINSSGGSMIINPMAASLYEGTMKGSVTIDATPPRISVKQNFRGVSINPLMRDALNRDALEGRGNVVLNVSGEGETVGAIKKGLNGTARIELRDGAIKGINIPGAIRAAKTKLGALTGEQVQAASTAEKTDFTELKALFTIKDGVAHDDLSAKSPLLRLTGSGSVDIGEEKLDYLLKATIVATLKGQGGGELGALRGITIPVRIRGPFDAPRFELDFNAMAGEAVRQKIEATREEVQKKATDTLTDTLKDRLKGLLP